jgi:hypothetical protein
LSDADLVLTYLIATVQAPKSFGKFHNKKLVHQIKQLNSISIFFTKIFFLFTFMSGILFHEKKSGFVDSGLVV